MEEVRDEQVKKHVCKLCNKRYPSGKSLGGHMRSHVIASRKALNFAPVNDDHDDGDDDCDDDEGNGNNEGKNSVYGLRENPKKTWRLVDNISGKNNQLLHTFHMQQQERVCKQCGKGFNSLKALCGHMSSHSDKDKNFKEQDDDDNSWSSDSKEHLFLAVESHSDNNNNNNSISKRQTRSSLSRYRSLANVDSVSPTGVCGGGGGDGGSSSNQSEIDQHEQEEVAMCLMMLSRDFSGYKTCLNFAAESSDNDNNSVILEGGSSSNYIGIGARRKDLNLINDKKKIKQVIFVAKKEVKNTQEINNSDSGYFENGAKALESDDSVDGFVRNYGLNKSKVEIGSRIVEDSCYDDDDLKKRKIREVVNFNFDSHESDENCSKKIMKQDYYCYNSGNNNNDNSIKKGSKYECWKCKKTFKSHQALGGHIISHRKTGDNSLETNISAKQLNNNNNPKNLVAATTTTKIVSCNKAKKVKGHKCPYCPRVFKSGQALGGHKRSHMMGGGSGGIVNLHLEAEKLRIERKRAPPPPPPQPEPQHQQPPMIDLNLPAPMEEW